VNADYSKTNKEKQYVIVLPMVGFWFVFGRFFPRFDDHK